MKKIKTKLDWSKLNQAFHCFLLAVTLFCFGLTFISVILCFASAFLLFAGIVQWVESLFDLMLIERMSKKNHRSKRDIVEIIEEEQINFNLSKEELNTMQKQREVEEFLEEVRKRK